MIYRLYTYSSTIDQVNKPTCHSGWLDQSLQTSYRSIPTYSNSYRWDLNCLLILKIMDSLYLNWITRSIGSKRANCHIGRTAKPKWINYSCKFFFHKRDPFESELISFGFKTKWQMCWKEKTFIFLSSRTRNGHFKSFQVLLQFRNGDHHRHNKPNLVGALKAF